MAAVCLSTLSFQPTARGAPEARAPASEGYRISRSAFTGGGNEGTILASSGFRLTLVALAEPALAPTVLAGVSFRMDGGIVSGARPPGEVEGLRFVDVETLQWTPHVPAVAYHLYRDLQCLATTPGLETASDPATPAPSQVLHYLITAENRLGEEGTPGADSSGTERPAPVACP